MNYHVFNGNIPIHAVHFIQALEQYSYHENFYIIVAPEEKNLKCFMDFFAEKCITRYYIVSHRQGKGKFRDFLSEKLWFYILCHARKSPVVLHGNRYPGALASFVILVGLVDNLFFVNWGATRFCRKVRSLWDKIVVWLNCKIASRINLITLMAPEKRVFQKYGFKNIFVQPYPHEDIPDMCCSKEKKLVLGNSLWSASNYLEFLRLLPCVKHDVSITVMANYGECEPSLQKTIEQELNLKFPNHFQWMTEYMTIEQYGRWIQQFSHGICPLRSQTGLGMIYNMIFYGNNMVLRGYNYLWLKSLKIKMFHVSEFIQEFPKLPVLPPEDIKQNYSIIYNLLTPEKNIPKWDLIFETL